MPDDRRDRSRRHYDAAAARRKPSAVPEAIDPADEVTPPPQEPPRLPPDDSIPPPIMERLDMLADGLGQATEAIRRVWDVRDLGPQVEQIDKRLEHVASEVAGYTRDVIAATTRLREFVEPAIKSLMARYDSVSSYVDQTRGRQEQFWAQDWPRLCTAIEKLDKRLDDVGERISRIERSIETHQHQLTGTAERISRVEAAGTAIELRVVALERRNIESDAGDRRQAKLLGWARGAVLALVAVGSAAATHVFNYLRGK